MSKTKRKCDLCNKPYLADDRNLKRGWGLCCSKSCSAKKRERLKPSYNPERVAYNNKKRKGLLSREQTGYYDRMPSYIVGDYEDEENFGDDD